jgi:hypothetical protein
MLRLNRSILVAVLAASAGTLHAANLIADADFSTDPASSWNPTTQSNGGNSASWAWDQTSGSPTKPGALHLTATNGATAQASQCVAMPSGTTSVDLIFRRYIVSETPPVAGFNSAYVDFIAYDGVGCAGNSVGGFASSVTSGIAGFYNGAATTNWDEVSGLSLPLSPSIPTVSVLVSIYVNPGASGAIDYLFSDVRFGPSGTTPVRLQTFDVE